MSELWWCVTCHTHRHFAVFDTNGFQFLLCQTCGGGICTTPETPTEEAS